MASSGSGGYGGPNFAKIEGDLRNIAIQFGSIVSLTQQIKASIDTFRLFERELTLANFAAGGTVQTFNQMEKAARNMALGSTNSVSQLANAFGNLARAGLDAKEVLAAATGVMLLANATLSDLGEAADITASTMAQFNLRADESGRIANLFVAASNNSLASMNKLAFAMRQVGPIAAQANLSLEQTVGMLDKLFDAGLRGEQAGTALRNTISRLVDPMGAGKDVLANLGVSALDAKGQVDIDAALRKLSTMNLSLRDVSEIAGVEAAAGMITLLNSIRDTNDGLDAHIAKISGTNDAYGQAMAQMATLDGSLSQAANAFNELRLIAGEAMAPVIIDLAQGFVDMVLTLREMDPAIMTLITQMLIAGAGIGIVTKAFSSLQAVTNTFQRSASALGVGITGIQLALDKSTRAAYGMGDAAMNASAGVGQLGKGMLGFIGIAGGILGVAAAVAAVTFSLVELQKAKDRAKIDEILGDDGLNGDQAKRNLRNTMLQYNVDDESGMGSLDKFAALEEQRKGALKAVEDGNKRLKDNMGARRLEMEEMAKQIEELREFSEFINSRMLSAYKTGDQGLAAAAEQLGSATAANWAASVQAYLTAYQRSIDNSNASLSEKERLKDEAKEKFEGIMKLDDEIRTQLQEQIKQQAAKGNQVEVNVFSRYGTAERSAIANAFLLLRDKFVLDRQQLETANEETATEIAKNQAVADRAAAEQEQLQVAMRNRVENFIKISFGSATEAGNTTADAIDRWIEKNPDRFVAIIRAAGTDTVKAIQMIQAESNIQVSRIQGALDALATGTVPRLQKEKIDEYWSKALTESVQAAGDTATAAVREAARKAKGVAGANTWRTEATAMIAGAISETEGGAIAPAIVAGIESGTIKTIDDVAVAVRAGGGMLTPGTAAATDRVVQAASMLYNANLADAAKSFRPTGGGGGRGRGGMSSGQRAMDKLLDLPTEAEFKLDAERMASDIRNTLASYFGFQADAYRVAMDEAELDYREDQLDFQRDFEKFWRDNIAKGLDVALDQGAISAISGRGFTLNGKEFTPDMLREEGTGAEYMSNLLEYLTPKIPANAPQYQARVDAMKRVVEELGGRSAGMWGLLQEQYKVIEIERRKAEEAAKQAAQGFDFDQAALLLQNQLDLITLSDPLNMNLKAAVSFDLELANIRGEANRQVDDLQSQYMAQFESLGVFAEVVGDDLKIATEQSGALTETQVAQADALIARYIAMRDTILQLTQAKISDAEAGVNGIERQREAWENYADSLEKVANANGNNADVMDDFLMGMQAGFSRFLADIPTSFEVGMAGMQEAVNGFASVSTDLVLGMGDDWRASVANILQSIAQMIMKMLIMAATLQMIRMIPGGTALLAAMDAGASIVSAGSAGVAAGTAVNTAGGGGRTTVNAYGGVHDHDQMMRGGVKRPGDTSMAIFGEGQWPEAFIPMVDGASIPVSMGSDGRFFVQLPSGQKVPVSMKGVSQKKHAYGGVSGNVTPSFDMRSMADGASMAGREATGYAGGGRRSAETSGGASTYNFYGGDVIIQGNADGNTAEEIGKQQAQAFGAMLTSHETEKDKQRLRREGRTGFSAKGTI